MPGFPLWVIALDYLLGLVMWTLIGRFAMGLFLAPDSSFFFMRFFVRVSDLFMRWFAPVAGVSDPRIGAALYRLVLLYGALLPDALAIGVFGHGHAAFPAGKRYRPRHRRKSPAGALKNLRNLAPRRVSRHI